MSLSIGQSVMFGQINGEKTKGVIEKVNRKTVRVRQMEPRKGYSVGSVWTVDMSLIYPIGDSRLTVAPVETTLQNDPGWNQAAPLLGLPAGVLGKVFLADKTEFKIDGINLHRPKYPIICIRTKDGKRFKLTVDAVLKGLKAISLA